ncbi:MAG: hypothetical protein Q8N83_04755 [Ignavibacteria bacterium]|nr:hypothetical protein [Ignavibacteria bacterium]
MVITKEEQVKTVVGGHRHIVILGAGSSIASCLHNPEENNKYLPSMDNCLDILGLEDKYASEIKKAKSKNLEVVFSQIYSHNPKSDLLSHLEKTLYEYFDNLYLPPTPTIYDYLVLSLRKKDLIATFNWDPFLWQAYERNLRFTDKLPTILFLHGSVAVGICENDKTFGPKGKICLKCKTPFSPTNILYPITKKNYHVDSYIQDQWSILLHGLENPVRVTVFGYSAPKSDIEAISLMKNVYNNSKIREFTQFEMIDIANKEFLTKSWKDFIFSHHYEMHDSFFESSIMKFPRRSGEVFKENILGGRFYEENYPPKFDCLEDMWVWFSRFLEYEK